MIPLKTENLDLKLNNNIVHLDISGPLAKESVEASLEWIKKFQNNASEANDNFAIQVDMPKGEFEDLSEMSRQFQTIGRMLRHSKSADKCAVITDSIFVRNSAKVESSVIPGLEIRTFDFDDTDVAKRWLKDEPLIQDVDEALSVVDKVQSDNPWDNLKIRNLSL